MGASQPTRVWLSLALASSILACGDAPLDDGSVEVRDSAGIRITTSSAPVEDAVVWSVPAQPSLTIATDPVDSRIVFHWVRGAVRLSDGRIVVVSESSHDLKFFNADGSFDRTAAGPGGGPGRLSSAYQLDRLPGDTLVVSERSGTRTWFGSDGGFVRRTQADRAALSAVLPPEHSPGVVYFVPPTHGVMAANAAGMPPVGQRTRFPKPHYLLVDGQDPPRLLDWFPGVEVFLDRYGQAGLALFANNAYMAAGGDPPRVYLGDSAVYDVHVYDTAGNLVLLIRDAVPPDPIRSEDIALERAAFFDFGRASNNEQAYTRYVEAMPLPATKPAFDRLVVDSEGHLWVKEYGSFTAAPVRYRIYAPSGERIATAFVPGRVRVYDIGIDYVLGVMSDADYAESIVLYELKR